MKRERRKNHVILLVAGNYFPLAVDVLKLVDVDAAEGALSHVFI